MKQFSFTILILAFLMLGAANALLAQDKGIIDLRMVAEVEVKVTNDNGEIEIQRTPAARVIPGDEVIYTIYYSNTGSKSAEEVVIVNPIPEHMIYSANSAFGNSTIVMYSVDNGKTFAAAKELMVVDKTGKKRPARESDYTHIRWAMAEPLEAGANGSVGFKAQLE